MKFEVLKKMLYFCIILVISLSSLQSSEANVTLSNNQSELMTSLPPDSDGITESTRSLRFNWQIFKNMIGELLVVKKNILAAYPFQIASTAIDMLCSSTLFMHHVPQKFTPDITQMKFQLITSCKNYSVPLMQAEKLWLNMNFNRLRKVVILATGWTNTLNDSTTLALLSKAFLCRKDVNFIIVDTASYVDTLYKWAALNTEEIGEHIANGLSHLVKKVPLRNIHLVGHSLGAHIMGAAGRTFTNLTGFRIPRITGLDPAKPCFRKNETLSSLRRGDAEFVDIIHTNIGILAKAKPIGDVDFYPGGANALPPGCLTISCAHTRSVQYFAESVYPGNEQNFLGSKCDNWRALKQVNCSDSIRSPMGYMANQLHNGIFYVAVNRRSPYGKNISAKSVVAWEKVKCKKC